MWMSVFLINYQLNIMILFTTVTLMPSVPIPKDHFTAHVIRDTLEMESSVLVSVFDSLCALNRSKINMLH